MPSLPPDRRAFDRQWLGMVDVSRVAAAGAEPPRSLLSEQLVAAAAAAHEESRTASVAQLAAQADCERASAAVVEAQSALAVAAATVMDLVAQAREAAAAATLAAEAAAKDAAAAASAVGEAAATARANAAGSREVARSARGRVFAPARQPLELQLGGPPVGHSSARLRRAPAQAQPARRDVLDVNVDVAGGATAAAAAASAERLSDLAAARSVGEVVQASREAALMAAKSAALAAEAESAAATLAIASSTVRSARAVAAAVDAKAAVVEQAELAARVARTTEAQLTHEVLHDELTGLANRRLLVDRLAQALARSGRGGTYVGVLFIDVDGLKQVNDTYGHARGDELLIGVAQQLQARLRDTDTCARVGGDEFVVVCEDLSHPSDGPLVAGRLEASIAAGVVVGEDTVPVRVSIGVAVGATSSVPLDLLRDADSAMYRIKQSRRKGG